MGSKLTTFEMIFQCEEILTRNQEIFEKNSKLHRKKYLKDNKI